jgi:hypothetical protein
MSLVSELDPRILTTTDPRERQRLWEESQARAAEQRGARDRSSFWRVIRWLANGSERALPVPKRQRADIIEIAKKAAGIGDGPEFLSCYPIAASLGWDGDRAVWTVMTAALAIGANTRIRVDDRSGGVLSIELIGKH